MSLVEIARSISQIRDGLKYEGTVEIGASKFSFTLTFSVAINRLDSMPEINSVDEARKIFVIDLTKDGRRIELTNEEWGFFYHLIVIYAVEYYNQLQTRGANEGEYGSLLAGGHPLAAFGVTVSIGMSGTATYEISCEACSMLNAEKFGCALDQQ